MSAKPNIPIKSSGDQLTADELNVIVDFFEQKPDPDELIPGPQGETGPQGEQGIQGETGIQGDMGYSAYEIAVQNGFVGSESEWLDSLTPLRYYDGDIFQGDGETEETKFTIGDGNINEIKLSTELRTKINSVSPSMIIDVSTQYGVVADGETDNSTSLMQMRSELAGPNKPKYQLYFPTGDIRYSNNRWLFGIEKFDVFGNGSTFRTIYSGSDEMFQRPFNAGSIWQDNLLSYVGTKEIVGGNFINTTTSGSLSITLRTPSEHSNYAIGNRILVYSYDQTGLNYPYGTRYNEWHEIDSINTTTGEITLKKPLRYKHDQNIWDEASLDSNTKGKARIISLDRENFVYPRYAGFHNLTFGDSTDGTGESNIIFCAEELFMGDDVKSESGYFWPSENKVARYNGMTVNGGVELDQVVGNVQLYDMVFNHGLIGPTGTENIRVNYCQFGEAVQVNPRSMEIRNSIIRANTEPDPYAATLSSSPQKSPIRRMVLENLTFTESEDSLSEFHIDFAEFLTYTITHVSGKDIIIPFISHTDATTTLIPYKSEAGITRLFKTDGSKGGVISSITFDGSYNSGQGAYVISGNWGAIPEVGETWGWSTVAEVIDLGGHIVHGNKRLWGNESLRWAGNRTGRGEVHTMHIKTESIKWLNGNNESVIPFYGKIIDIEGIVGKPYNGSSTGVTIVIMANDYSTIAQINLMTTGRRYLSEYVSQGLKTGDTLDQTKCGVWHSQLRIITVDNGGSIDDVNPEALPEVDIIIRWTEF